MDKFIERKRHKTNKPHRKMSNTEPKMATADKIQARLPAKLRQHNHTTVTMKARLRSPVNTIKARERTLITGLPNPTSIIAHFYFFPKG